MNRIQTTLNQFVKDLRKNGVQIDVDVVDEFVTNLGNWQNLLRQQRGAGFRIYQVPQAIHEWGSEQHTHEVNWADLFFDLTFVGSTLKLGILLEHVLLLPSSSSSSFVDDTLLGLFFFASLFITMRSVWEAKLQFTSRFSSLDWTHKIFDISEALVSALLALHMPSTLLVNRTLFLYTVFRLTLFGFNILRWLQVVLLSRSRSAQRMAAYFLFEGSSNFIAMGLSLWLIQLNRPLWEVSLLFVISDSSFVLDLLRSCIKRFNTKHNTIPIHVESVIHREGEFTMLMIGEGVLSLILLDLAYTDLGQFSLSFLLLSTLQFLHYSAQPLYLEGHALFRSRIRGVIWLKIQIIESLLLVTVGVCLKVLLKSANNAVVGWLLAASLTGTHLIIIFLQLLHLGVEEELNLPWLARNIKLALYGFRILMVLTFLLVPWLSEDKDVVLGLFLLISLVLIAVHQIWHTVDAFFLSAISMVEDINVVQPNEPYGDYIVEIPQESTTAEPTHALNQLQQLYAKGKSNRNLLSVSSPAVVAAGMEEDVEL